MRTIDLDFTYFVSYRLHRNHSFDNQAVSDRTTLEFRDVARSAVDLVARIGNRRTKAGVEGTPLRFARKEDGGPRDLVWFEGALWIEGQPFEAFAERLRRDPKAEGTPFERRRELYTGGKVVTDPDMLKTGGKRIMEKQNGRSKAVERLEKVAARTLVVDGIVYEKVFEPVLTLVRGFGKPHEIRLAGFLDDDAARISWDGWDELDYHTVALDQLDALRDHLDARGVPYEVGFEHEIVDPTRIHATPRWRTAVLRRRRILEKLMPIAGKLDALSMDAVLRLRDAWTENPDAISNEGIEAMKALLQCPAFSTLADPSDSKHPGRRGDDDPLVAAASYIRKTLLCIADEDPARAWTAPAPSRVVHAEADTTILSSVADIVRVAQALDVDPDDMLAYHRSGCMTMAVESEGTAWSGLSGLPQVNGLAAVDAAGRIVFSAVRPEAGLLADDLESLVRDHLARIAQPEETMEGPQP